MTLENIYKYISNTVEFIFGGKNTTIPIRFYSDKQKIACDNSCYKSRFFVTGDPASTIAEHMPKKIQTAKKPWSFYFLMDSTPITGESLVNNVRTRIFNNFFTQWQLVSEKEKEKVFTSIKSTSHFFYPHLTENIPNTDEIDANELDKRIRFHEILLYNKNKLEADILSSIWEDLKYNKSNN